jgi:hypothetical protein
MNKQRGFVGVLSALVILTFSAYATKVFYDLNQKQKEQILADQAGRSLQELNFAVMRYLSERGISSTPGTYTGSSWLKGPSCGGPAVSEFLPNCNFRDANPFGDSYETVVSVAGSVATAVITLPYPLYKAERNPVLASRVRSIGASFISGSTPVSQTFSDYILDKTNETIVVTTSTSSSTDIWYRTDGSNQMNANANLGGNAMYNVSSIYGAATAVEDLSSEINVGSAVNVAGVLTVESVGSNNQPDSGHIVVNTFNDENYSFVATGGLSTAFVDSFGVIRVGDGSGATSNARITFNQSNSAADVFVESRSTGDLEIRNGNGDATVIADRFYSESVNRFTDQALYNLTVVRSGTSVPKPNCRAGLTPQIFTAIAGLASNPARPISAFDIQPVDTGTNWVVNVILKTDGPGNVPGAILESRVLVAVKCS